MRKTIAAMLAGILSFGAVNSHAQSQASLEEMAAAVIQRQHYENIVRNKASSISPLEQISGYDLLPIIYSIERNTLSAYNSLTATSSDLHSLNVYQSSAGSVRSELSAGNPTLEQPNVYTGFDLFESGFHGKVNVITNPGTIQLVGKINGKGIEITYAPNGQISGFYGDLRAQGKVVAYDKNHLPKRIVVQLGPYIYEQNATYKDGVISGHEAKRVDGKSLDSLVAAQ